VKERWAVTLVKPIGASIHTRDDASLVVSGMSILPGPSYRPPGHPERPNNPGPLVWMELRTGSIDEHYFEAPLLVHQDHYCATHHHIDHTPLVRLMEELASTGIAKNFNLAEAVLKFRSAAMNMRPIVVRPNWSVHTMSQEPIDAFVCFDLIWTRSVQ
jgi:hypothetical protein